MLSPFVSECIYYYPGIHVRWNVMQLPLTNKLFQTAVRIKSDTSAITIKIYSLPLPFQFSTAFTFISFVIPIISNDFLVTFRALNN